MTSPRQPGQLNGTEGQGFAPPRQVDPTVDVEGPARPATNEAQPNLDPRRRRERRETALRLPPALRPSAMDGGYRCPGCIRVHATNPCFPGCGNYWAAESGDAA
jgi:hypothetical protein